MSTEIVIIAHNIRSTHNVGSLLRTAEGLGIHHVYFTGYTPYPHKINDERLPHISNKLHQQIQKTALGAEDLAKWSQSNELEPVIDSLRQSGFLIAGLEQTHNSQSLPEFSPPKKIAILLGSEVTGIDPDLIAALDLTLEIPMTGQKESFNVVEAATMAMYHCTFR